MNKIKVLVVGCGNMGASHARAYHKMDEFEIVGLVSRGPESRGKLSDELGGLPQFSDYYQALDIAKPDAVSINTYPETHYEYVAAALKRNCHAFVEKPIALTVKEAQGIADLAAETGRKVVVGYILRHHPSWTKFIEVARTLGKPLVMRMNLNQQSTEDMWQTHKSLMNSMSPMVDCGVHYVDVMCQMTRSKPVRVQAIGARLTDEIPEDMYNYGQLQVVFEDGSVGWYEAGWGPMMSETAFFVKDVVGPDGSASLVEQRDGSDDIDAHTRTGGLLRHYSQLLNGKFTKKDELIDLSDEPAHQALCDLEQAFFLKAIKEDIDLTDHLQDAVNSLQVVLAADESVRTGRAVDLVDT
ncbi:MAG: Gfo/Idh/MocA family oxidoreductase [Lentisphaerae bacterium]|nr:Gfo/Idh/MocA family oxidoreductase [Lentisphaerota bacterium]